MHRIQTRTELIQFAQANCKSYACERAFLTGRVTVLGGFNPIPPGTAPGWILTVVSVHRHIWILAIVTDDIKHCYHLRRLDKIPWANWEGDPVSTFKGTEIVWQYSIRDGDVPKVAYVARLNAIQGT